MIEITLADVRTSMTSAGAPTLDAKSNYGTRRSRKAHVFAGAAYIENWQGRVKMPSFLCSILETSKFKICFISENVAMFSVSLMTVA
jgi:hypothetical protein